MFNRTKTAASMHTIKLSKLDGVALFMTNPPKTGFTTLSDIYIFCFLDIILVFYKLKSRIRETKNLSTDADSSTNTTVGWTKNTQKPNFFEKKEKIIQNTKTQKRLEICQN